MNNKETRYGVVKSINNSTLDANGNVNVICEDTKLKDLEVLEMLRGIIQVYCVKRKRNNFYILASKNPSLTEEEYIMIKEWLNNE